MAAAFQSVEQETFRQGTDTAIKDPTSFIIRGQIDFARFWKRLSAENATSKKPIPSYIDWSKCMLVGVFLGETALNVKVVITGVYPAKDAGYSVHFSEVVDDEKKPTIDPTISKRYPFHVVKVPLVSGTVDFIESTTRSDSSLSSRENSSETELVPPSLPAAAASSYASKQPTSPPSLADVRKAMAGSSISRSSNPVVVGGSGSGSGSNTAFKPISFSKSITGQAPGARPGSMSGGGSVTQGSFAGGSGVGKPLKAGAKNPPTRPNLAEAAKKLERDKKANGGAGGFFDFL